MTKRNKPVGWRYESDRHAMASKGIKTAHARWQDSKELRFHSISLEKYRLSAEEIDFLEYLAEEYLSFEGKYGIETSYDPRHNEIYIEYEDAVDRDILDEFRKNLDKLSRQAFDEGDLKVGRVLNKLYEKSDYILIM